MNPTLNAADGLTLHLREWPRPDARGTVLIVHGLGEHVGRHAHVAAQLNAWGWNVVGYDQRGHGASEGARGALARSDDLVRDLAWVVDAVRDAHPGPLVLSSPALDAGMNAFQKLLLAVLGPLAPNLAVGNGLNPAWISRDPAVVTAYQADPLVHDRVTPRLARFIVDAGEFVRARAAQWSVPTLLLYAGSDRCVAPAGSAALAATAPREVLTAREFAPLFHEIFNEPERREVFAVLGEWLGRAGLSSGRGS
jgi:alpha-beta hydrolase superfamily lysophospholipase